MCKRRYTMSTPHRKSLGVVNTCANRLASKSTISERIVRNARSKKKQQQNLNLHWKSSCVKRWSEYWWTCCLFQKSHLVFEICYLVLEVADVLAWVCVVQLALDLSFFLLLVEDTSINISCITLVMGRRLLLILRKVKKYLSAEELKLKLNNICSIHVKTVDQEGYKIMTGRSR